MRDLQKVFQNCITMMDEIHMDYGNITKVTVNTRAKSRWGQCKCKVIGFKYNGSPLYEYSINISSLLLNERVPIEALQNTIIHEILHTCPDCLNHGYEWKRRAAIVKNKLGYDIKRCSDADEKGIDKNLVNGYRKPNYIVRCKKCGREVNKMRMCSIVKYPELWRCGVCSGEFERVK